MKKQVWILLHLIFFSVMGASAQSSFDGLWTGNITSNGIDLIMDIEIDTSSKKALLSVPIQGLSDIASSSLSIVGKKIKINFAMFRAQYEGTLNDAGIIQGTWTQGSSISLDLSPSEKKTIFLRPQTPQPPYPYLSSEHKITNQAAGVTLAATLTMPEGEGPFPLAILISGSGRQDRNSNILGHEPFLVIADHLTRAGIAVLRYDDRGVGHSSGNHANATTADLATDAEAVWKYARELSKIDQQKIGFIGHSEGGMIAPMIAGRQPDISYIVSLAGPAVPITQLMTQQNLQINKQNGMSEEGLKITEQQLPIIYSIVNQEKEPREIFDTLISAVHAYYEMLPEADQTLIAPNKASYYRSLSNSFFNPWFRYFLRYDPGPVWETVHCPVLAINGTKDIQVDAEKNLQSITDFLKKAGNDNLSVHPMSGLNHLMQPCESCNLAEYATIETTIDTSVLALIERFILDL